MLAQGGCFIEFSANTDSNDPGGWFLYRAPSKGGAGDGAVVGINFSHLCAWKVLSFNANKSFSEFNSFAQVPMPNSVSFHRASLPMASSRRRLVVLTLNRLDC